MQNRKVVAVVAIYGEAQRLCGDSLTATIIIYLGLAVAVLLC